MRLPLAKQFVPDLNAYAAKIAGLANCQRVKMAVEDTAKLLLACQTEDCHASTIDQLVNLILTKRCDDRIASLTARAADPARTLDAAMRFSYMSDITGAAPVMCSGRR